MRSYARIAPYILSQKPRLAWILALSLAGGALTAFHPWPLKLLVDYALKPTADRGIGESLWPVLSTLEPSGWILLAASLSLVFFAASSLLDAALAWAWTRLGQSLVGAVAIDAFDRLQRLPLWWHQARPVGDSLTRLTEDSWAIYKVADIAFIAPIQQVFTIAVTFWLAWQLHLSLALIALLLAPLMAVTSLFFGRHLKTHQGAVRHAESRLTSFVQQTFGALPLIQAYGSQPRNRLHFDALGVEWRERSLARVVVRQRHGLATGLIAALGSGALLFLGAREVLAQRLSLGSLLVFAAYLKILERQSLALLKTYAELKPVEANLDRLVEVLDARPEPAHAPQNTQPLTLPVRGELAFENVVFAYDDERPVLRGIDLHVRAGETVALVGPSGAGKTTLASLIPRFFDPTGGVVRLDGHDLRHLDLAQLRAQVALVPQTPFFFARPVWENLSYGRPAASHSEIVEAARAAQAHDFIQRLPHGYDTVLAEGATTLSGGEKQRLSIARALLKDTPILVLDEPTSALDHGTEAALFDTWDALTRGRTTILIAHRLTTVLRADRIVVLSGGQMVMQGTHLELLARCEWYRQAWQQFGHNPMEVAQ